MFTSEPNDLELRIAFLLQDNSDEFLATVRNDIQKVGQQFGVVGGEAGAAFLTNMQKSLKTTQGAFKEDLAGYQAYLKAMQSAAAAYYRDLNSDRDRARSRENSALRQAEEQKLALIKAAAREELAVSNETRRTERDEKAREFRESQRQASELARLQLEQQKQADRLLFNESQEASARRIARTKALYASLNTVVRASTTGANAVLRAGLTAGNNIVASFLRRREERHRQSDVTINAHIRDSYNQQIVLIQEKLEQGNAVYSRAAQKRLATIERTSATERTVITKNAVKTAEAQAAIQRRASKGIIGSAIQNSPLAGGLAGLLGAAGGGLLLRSVATETTEAIKVGRQTAAVIKSTGGAANVSRVAVEAYATKLSELAGIDDEVIQSGENLLLTFTNVRNIGKDRIFDEATKSALDMSVAMKQDLKSSVIQIGKALNDPIKGITALTRVGVTFTAQQKEQIKALVASGKTVEAQKMILRELNREFGGSAEAAATAGAKFKVMVDNIKESIGLTLYPVMTAALAGIVAFMNSLLHGQGVWAVVRGGLMGIAAGLAAILTYKAGVEVIGLLDAAVKLLAANPGFLVLAGLGATLGILATTPAFRSLVRGFYIVGKAGYDLKTPIEGLSTLVKIQSTLGYWTRITVDNFKSLANGFKVVGKAGYDLKSPIEGLSSMVKFQSSLGATGRVIHDFFVDAAEGFRLWREGFGTQGLQDAFAKLVVDIRRTLGGAKDAIVDALRPMIEAARDYLATVKINLGSFLLPALGLASGGDQGFISRMVTKAITKALLGGIANYSADIPAAQMGVKVHETVTKAFAFVKDTAGIIGTFFASLFSGKVDSDKAASRLGGAIHGIIADAFKRVGDMIGPIGDFFAKIGGAIAGFWGKFVIPKLIEIPRILGKFLAEVIFSEEFLKGLLAAAGALAAAAAIIAVQFIRGFAEGLWERRGDIIKTIHDILALAVKAILGTGNPFVIAGAALTAALVVGFAGSKVFGAISALRTQFGIAMAGMTGDAEKLRTAVAAAQNPPPEPGTSTSKLGNFMLGIGQAKNALKEFTVGEDNAARLVGQRFNQAGDRLDEFARRQLGIAEGAHRVGLAWKDEFTGNFVKQPMKGIDNLQTRLAGLAIKFSDEAHTIGSGFVTLGEKIESGAQKVGKFAKAIGNTIPENTSKAQLAVQVGASAITGYMAGMADTFEAKAIGIVASAGEIAAAFAAGGPIVGAVTAAVTVISYFYGQAKKKAQEAAAEQKRQAAELAETAKSVRADFKGAFSTIGNSDTSAQGLAVFDVFAKQLDENSARIRQFRELFGGTIEGLSAAAAKGKKALSEYLTGLKTKVVEDFVTGNRDVATAIGKDFPHAAKVGAAAVQEMGGRLAALNDHNDKLRDAILKNGVALASGKIGFKDYIKNLEDAGVSTKTISELTAIYAQEVGKAVDATKGGQFIKVVADEMRKGVSEYREQTALQDAFNYLLEQGEGAADRFAAAYSRIRDGIDKAVSAYRNWLDLTTGKQKTRNEAIISILDAAKAAGEAPPEGESALETQAKKENALLEQRSQIAEQLAQMWKDSGGDMAKFNQESGKFFDDLRSAAPDQAAVDFINQLQVLSMNPDALEKIKLGLELNPKSITDIKRKVSDFTTEHPEITAELKKARTFDDQKRIILEELVTLANSDPTIKSFIEKGDGYEGTVNQILADKALFDTEVTLKVNAALVTNAAEKVANQIKNFFPGLSGTFNATPQRWGGVNEVARFGRIPAHVVKNPSILYGERETGGEAMIPRLGNYARSLKILRVAAGWYGAAVVPMAQGGIAIPSTSASFGGHSPTSNTNIHHELKVENRIYESTSPRRTAMDVVRGIRAAKFLGGATLPAGAFA